MDDDTVLLHFDAKRIKKLLKCADIVGGVVDGIELWKGLFRKHCDRLIHLYGLATVKAFPRPDELNIKFYDFIPNFFVGHTEPVAAIGWNKSLKVCEHSEFFWRAHQELKITQTDALRSTNCRDRNKRYARYRGRTKHFSELEKKELGVKAFDFVDPNNLRVLVIKNPALYDHPQGYMEEFQERLGDGHPHSLHYVWESDTKAPNFPWHRYNLVVSNFTWFGPRERPPHTRCVYLNDDMHWNSRPDVRKEMIETTEAADLFFTPYADHIETIPEYKNVWHKAITFPYALPWWFEPNQWSGRKPLIACSGGTHSEIYPLRTEIYRSKDPNISWLGHHPGWKMSAAPGSIVRAKYSNWLNQHQGGLATFGYGRFPSGNIPYLVCKYLEVAATTCPFFEELPGLDKLGFKPYEHYIPVNIHNWRDQFTKWLKKPEKMREIFLNSSALVSERHYIHHRVNEFWDIVTKKFGWTVT